MSSTVVRAPGVPRLSSEGSPGLRTLNDINDMILISLYDRLMSQGIQPMTEHTAFENEMRGRLGRMERELRCWRLGGTLVLTLTAVVVAGAMAAPPVQEMSVTTLRIVDQQGKDRIVLTADPKVPDMIFLDPAGKSRLTLDIAADHKPVLSFSESGKESRLTIGLEEGTPMLNLYDQAGKKRVAFGIPRAGGAVLRVLDANEQLQTRFP
jgi:hypothetical protein